LIDDVLLAAIDERLAEIRALAGRVGRRHLRR
jgi:hypothetical protein